jgi:hypothetical protein
MAGKRKRTVAPDPAEPFAHGSFANSFPTPAHLVVQLEGLAVALEKVSREHPNLSNTALQDAAAVRRAIRIITALFFPGKRHGLVRLAEHLLLVL